jgi:DNA-binding transcriptional ArsR family regulator
VRNHQQVQYILNSIFLGILINTTDNHWHIYQGMKKREIVEIAEYRNPVKPIEVKPSRTPPFIPPIPEWWAAIAMPLPGKAYHVGSIIWQQWRINRSASCKLTRHVWEKFGLHRHTVRGGLKALNEAGLIILEKSGKRSPLITIVNDESHVTGIRAGRKRGLE